MNLPTPLEGPCHRIVLNDSSDRLAIYFGAKDLRAETFNFFQSGRETETHTVFLNNGANRWYQDGIPGLGSSPQEVVASLKAWMERLGVTQVCTIGTSMGGYAAIHYGCLLQARILAFSSDVCLGEPYSQSAKYMLKNTPLSAPDLRGGRGNSDQLLRWIV
ncbi:alpha/beta fold hydrolase [Phycobacter azelaicus]|uniref:alpha/beta fold hydrolase n=1 Tax=Phycobacter azelaicus TaxID=2668075 RepID=UPI001A061BD9|nr:hypothetical protein [Phycobacter azelaicus]MBE1295624.1 hypothetical protein [Paracoccaceae bacterium]